MTRLTARNIRVENILKVLSSFKPSDYVDITAIRNDESNVGDVVKISPIGNGTNTKNNVREWFKFDNLNDFIV